MNDIILGELTQQDHTELKPTQKKHDKLTNNMCQNLIKNKQ